MYIKPDSPPGCRISRMVCQWLYFAVLLISVIYGILRGKHRLTKGLLLAWLVPIPFISFSLWQSNPSVPLPVMVRFSAALNFPDFQKAGIIQAILRFAPFVRSRCFILGSNGISSAKVYQNIEKGRFIAGVQFGPENAASRLFQFRMIPGIARKSSIRAVNHTAILFITGSAAGQCDRKRQPGMGLPQQGMGLFFSFPIGGIFQEKPSCLCCFWTGRTGNQVDFFNRSSISFI